MARLVTPRNVLALFLLGLLAFALTRSGHSAESVDVRTYVEMTFGISRHGLPYLDNGPVAEHIALRSPFNLWTHGHLWGIYGPVFPYYAAIPMRLGGLVAASIATALLLLPVALVTYAFVKKLTEDAWCAVGAAILVVVSTPVLGKSLEISAYPLTMLLAVAAATATLEAQGALDVGTRTRWAAIAGVLAALGTATHMLGVPVAAALLGALALTDPEPSPEREPAWLARTWLASLWPSVRSIRAAVTMGAVMVVCTIPLAMLNKVRFGSYNPYSYGPVPWHGMEYLGAQDQTISAHLKAAAVFLALLVVVVLVWTALALVANKWLARGVFFAAVVALVLFVPFLRDGVVPYLRSAYAFILDMSLVEMPPPYHRIPGGFGNLHGPWLVKSTLQCSPVLALALVVPRLSPRSKQRVLVALAPCAALYVYLTIRGNLPLYSALGVPWAYIRYTFPALPLLLGAAMLVVKEADLRPRHWAIAAAVAGAMIAVLAGVGGFDDKPYRHWLVLALPLASAAVSAILVLLARVERSPRALASIAVAVTCGVGVGVGMGHDLACHVDGKRYCDYRSDVMRRVTPERFAMFGYHPTLDPVLGVKYERDVEYADIAEGPPGDPWLHVRPLVDKWFAEGRPVYFVADDNEAKALPWDDVVTEPADERERIYLVKPRR